MLRALSGRHTLSKRSGKAGDRNQALLDDESPLGIVDLARTVDDDDDSRFVLYSDVEEDVRDFELHALLTPSQRGIKNEGPSRRKKRQSPRSLALSGKPEPEVSLSKEFRRSSRVSKSQQPETATPVRAIEMRHTFLNDDAPDLDGIIRAFAKRRDSPRQMKRRGLSRRKKKSDGLPEEDASSYQSGFSSSESSGSSRHRVISLLCTPKPDLQYMHQKGESSSSKEFNLDMDDVCEADCHYDSCYVRYGNSNVKKSRQNKARFEGCTSHVLAPTKPLETDTMSSAGESDTCSRRSFSSIVSYTRSFAGSSVRRLWNRKMNTTKTTTHPMDHTERTAESGSSIPIDDYIKVAEISAPTLSKKLQATSVILPSSTSMSQTAGPLKSNGSLCQPRAAVTSLPLATGTMPLEVKGFDCDTGAFATQCDLANSSILDPNSKSIQATVRLTKQFIGVPLHDYSTRSLGNSSLSSEPRVSFIIDPKDMKKFLKSSEDTTPHLQKRGAVVDDDISSLSSNSTLTFSPTSVSEETNEYFFHTKQAEKSVSIRAKSLISSRVHNLKYGGLNDAADQLSQASANLRLKKSPSTAPLKKLQNAYSPKRTYAFPSTLQVPSSQQSISVLLIEPVLKVFEIVSVGLSAHMTARDVIKSACIAAADEVLSRQTYVSLCGATHVITNIDDLVTKLLPSARGYKHGSAIEENMRREMERTLIVAVPENSNPSECSKIRHMLWKNPKLQVWWNASQKGRVPLS